MLAGWRVVIRWKWCIISFDWWTWFFSLSILREIGFLSLLLFVGFFFSILLFSPSFPLFSSFISFLTLNLSDRWRKMRAFCKYHPMQFKQFRLCHWLASSSSPGICWRLIFLHFRAHYSKNDEESIFCRYSAKSVYLKIENGCDRRR